MYALKSLMLLAGLWVGLGSGLPDLQAAQRERGPVVAFGAEREAIKRTPIEERPYRPLHFYGNTVRRINNRR